MTYNLDFDHSVTACLYNLEISTKKLAPFSQMYNNDVENSPGELLEWNNTSLVKGILNFVSGDLFLQSTST